MSHGTRRIRRLPRRLICNLRNEKRHEDRREEAEVAGDAWRVLACSPEAGRQQVEAAAAAAVADGGGEGGGTKSCMSSRVVVVSIKPIIIANAYASLSANVLGVFPAKAGEDCHCLGKVERGGVRCLVGATVVV